MSYRHFTSILAAVALSLPALGAEPVTYTFECDTPAAHWSEWTSSISGADIRAIGKITVNQIRIDEKWMPAASIMIRGKQDGKDAAAGITLSGSKLQPDKIFISINAPGLGESRNLGTVPSTTTEFQFEVTLDTKGQLHVRLGGQESTRQLEGFAPEKLALSCSTGDFEFTEIKVSAAAK